MGSLAAGDSERAIFVNGQHSGPQLIFVLWFFPIACAEHVGHQHHVVFTGDSTGLSDGIGADSLPVRLHENWRAFSSDAVVVDDHALELPAVNLVRHLFLSHFMLLLPFGGGRLTKSAVGDMPATPNGRHA